MCLTAHAADPLGAIRPRSAPPWLFNPHSEIPDTGSPEDYTAHHPNEHPTDWGWHGEWGRAARITGWIVAAILIVMLTATHYNHSGSFWLIFFAVALVVVMIWDIQRRKNAWRK